jgi:fructokinase
MSYVACIGEALIDFAAQAGTADIGASELFRRAAGGAVANVSVGIARLGGNAHFIGAMSDDPFGQYLLCTLSAEKVNVAHVRIVKTQTTLAFVARGPRGARDFLFLRNPGADSQLSAADVNDTNIAGAAVVHFGGVLLATEPARAACFAAAAAGRRLGALVTFDPNARENLWSSHEEMRRVLIAGCKAENVVKLSDDDARALGINPSNISELLNETTRAVVLTLGQRGAAFALPGEPMCEVRNAAIEAVDTTGAGDAVSAALLWRLKKYNYQLDAKALLDAVRYGCAAGAAKCLKEGAIPGLPTVEEVQAMLARLPLSS